MKKPLQEYLTKGFFKIFSREKMVKTAVKIDPKNFDAAFGRVKKALGESYACYVLITCTEPNAEGKMEVQMNYEGDECLAAYLVENATQVFDSGAQMKESK